VTRATLAKDPSEVAAMFDEVAPRYDLTNAVLSMGQDRGWRTATTDALGLTAGERVLDLAAGTATSSAALAKSGALVVGCDFSLGLPFADASFDAVTIAFGLRNTADIQVTLAEMRRVTKPGGRIVVCEFSHPTWSPFRTVYVNYLMRALPAVATKVSSDPAAYVYLAESIRAWPDQAGLAKELQKAGWSRVGWRNLTGGIVALHRGTNPA
jgi:demethylmenaquinone methyltransferase/2-methoxy-6-polyprenyl-1,4-benzoquinol methylase